MTATAATTLPQSRHSIGVLVADDHAAVARGIERLIGDQPDLRVVGVAPDAQRALALPGCDVALVDYHLGQRSGLWLTLKLKRRPDPPGVVLYSGSATTCWRWSPRSRAPTGCCASPRPRRSCASRSVSSRPALSAEGARGGGGGCVELADRARGSSRVQLLAHGWAAPRIAEHLGIDCDQVEQARDAAVDVLAPAASRARSPLAPVRTLRASPPAR